jgi:hypothetical protein
MSGIQKLSVIAVGVFASIIVLRHADMAMHASVPKDMPQNAQFVQSGFDVSRNEAQGEWIACQTNASEGDNWCRVTDQRGMVVYQGGFLPVGSPVPVPENQLKIAETAPDKMWVEGPFEAGPVPVIPLRNGQVLVPETDQAALATRWAKDPGEFQQVVSERQ